MSLWSSLFGGAAGGVDADRIRSVVAAGSLVVDVRTTDEFASGHVGGAINVPVQGIGSRLGELGPKDRPIVVYCRSGGRSAQAAAILRSAGWAEVIDVGPMSAFPTGT
ncbi:MAG: rhodanese-like domain-containing protein [Myxococcota bacterium]